MQAESRIRAVIVDDEKPARERIRGLLTLEPDVDIIAEYGDAVQAAHALEREPPDVLFLDIQMPQLDGMRLLREMQARTGVHVIFVTAFAEHALSAFDLAADDYLLKPFDPDRFSAALERVRTAIQRERAAADNVNARDILRGVTAARTVYPAHIPVRTAHDIILVPTDTIDWIEAMGNYARLHVGPATHLLRESMQKLETALDPAKFVRVHRSTIVNIDRIRRMRPMYHGEFEIVLADGTTVMMSRSYKERMRERWGSWL